MPAIQRPSGAELAPKALEIAHGFAASGLKEATGRNDGEQIDKIESFFGDAGRTLLRHGPRLLLHESLRLPYRPTDG